MSHPIEPGTVITGYCGGVFGRDSYGEHLCVDSGYDSGEPWAVFRELDGWKTWKALHGEDVTSLRSDPEEDNDG